MVYLKITHLYTNEIRVRDAVDCPGHAPVQSNERFDCMLRIRHQQDLIPCTISVEDSTVRIQSHESIRGVASQQIEKAEKATEAFIQVAVVDRSMIHIDFPIYS